MGTEYLWIIFVLVGASLVAGAAFFFVRTRRFLATALTTTGTVVGFEHGRRNKGGITYRPRVAFTTPEGVDAIFIDQMGSNPPRFQVGSGGLRAL